jgi:sugar lactone lactonase YvrE
VITEMGRPNGTCISPDESRLYVVDIGHIRMFDMHGAAKNVAAFLRHLGARRVVLFGSLVTGSYQPDSSDIDLFLRAPSRKGKFSGWQSLIGIP